YRRGRRKAMSWDESGWVRENVIAYLKGELEGEPLDAFERALAADPGLRSEVERGREVLDLLEAAGERKVVELVNGTLREAIRRGASDIHLVPGRKELVTWLRIDGRLEELDVSPLLPGERRIPPALRPAVLNRWKQISECSLRDRQP